MSKKTSKDTEAQQPTHVGELLLNGTVTLTATTREELAEMVDEIPSDCKYGAGAVGKNPETGAYTLRIDIIK